MRPEVAVVSLLHLRLARSSLAHTSAMLLQRAELSAGRWGGPRGYANRTCLSCSSRCSARQRPCRYPSGSNRGRKPNTAMFVVCFRLIHVCPAVFLHVLTPPWVLTR